MTATPNSLRRISDQLRALGLSAPTDPAAAPTAAAGGQRLRTPLPDDDLEQIYDAALNA